MTRYRWPPVESLLRLSSDEKEEEEWGKKEKGRKEWRWFGSVEMREKFQIKIGWNRKTFCTRMRNFQIQSIYSWEHNWLCSLREIVFKNNAQIIVAAFTVKNIFIFIVFLILLFLTKPLLFLHISDLFLFLLFPFYLLYFFPPYQTKN